MFSFSHSLFFWTLINFLILLFLVSKFALPSFLNMVEEAEKAKQQALDELEHNRQESRRLLAEYQSKLAHIQEESDKAYAKIAEEVDAFKRQEFDKVLVQKHEMLSSVQHELQNEKFRFVEDMKLHAANLIVATTKKVIQKEVLREDHEALIQQNISDFEKLIKEAA